MNGRQEPQFGIVAPPRFGDRRGHGFATSARNPVHVVPVPIAHALHGVFAVGLGRIVGHAEQSACGWIAFQVGAHFARQLAQERQARIADAGAGPFQGFLLLLGGAGAAIAVSRQQPGSDPRLGVLACGAACLESDQRRAVERSQIILQHVHDLGLGVLAGPQGRFHRSSQRRRIGGQQLSDYVGRKARGGVGGLGPIGGRGGGGPWGIRLLAALGNWLARLFRPGSGFPWRMRLWKADTC